MIELLPYRISKCHRQSKRLIVVFSGYLLNHQVISGSFTYYKYFSGSSQDYDILFVRDPLNIWYVEKIETSDTGTLSVESLAETQEVIQCSRNEFDHILKTLQADYSYVTFFGSSMGGYGALLYAYKVCPNLVVTLCPQTFHVRGYPRFKSIHQKYIFSDLAQLNYTETKTKLHLLVGAENLYDIYHATRIKSSLASLTLVPLSCHNVPLYFHRLDRLQLLINSVTDGSFESYLEKLQNAYKSYPTLQPYLKGYKVQGILESIFHNIYIDQDFQLAENLLTAIIERFPWLAGAKRTLGLLWYEQNVADPRIPTILIDALHSAYLMDDAYGPLAHSLTCSGKVDEAIDWLHKGLKINKEAVRRSIGCVYESLPKNATREREILKNLE
ncbi:MAG: hypothetical protein WBA13_08635 [Microcoleaceae cyanobacterium]